MTNEPQFKINESPRRRSLAETVAHQILKAIEELPPDTRLPSEQELMKQMRVGRSAVREALSGLVLLGAIEIRQGQGAFVTGRRSTISAQEDIESALAKGETRDLLEVRRLIEIEVVRLAAERRTQEDLVALEQVLVAHEADLEHERRPDQPAARFHLVLAEASHNEVLANLVQTFFSLMVARVPTTYALEGFAEWELTQHRGLVDAIEAQDAALAVKRMHEHLEAMADRYRRTGTA